MPKYDFPGIKKAGAAAIAAVLSSTGWGSSLLAGPFKKVTIKLIEVLVGYLASKGLLIINLGAIYVEGEIDQSRFDKAMDSALEAIRLKNLTPEQIKALDDEVIKAFRNFARVTRK